jgi:hypothetical protein|tara:strand:+ start:259 stop:465 length:207 start_codon:yes stop_codon:yes gene_type:complete
MKTGDLIQLSSYGQRREYNLQVSKVDKFGIVVKKMGPHFMDGWYKVQWFPSGQMFNHSRKELKFAKKS